MAAFAFDPALLPPPFDRARAARTLAEIAETGWQPEGAVKALLQSASGNSAYLARLMLREAALLPRLFAEGPAKLLEEAGAAALAVADAAKDIAAMQDLRAAKRQIALVIALADIAGVFTLEDVTGALTRFADAAVVGALRFALKQTAAASPLKNKLPAALEAETGLVVLAMGKYGAFELNYSSDIDLVVFYDAAKFPFRKRDDVRGAAIDLVKQLVRLISDITVDGYVFRVDLRLRPDAGATQIAISTEAAEAYYEGMGQNWERAAFIKARPCAGDPATARQFIAHTIAPFVWRKNLDFAAIEDIQSIKRQIHAYHGHSEIAVAGHNIKLGRGGIREIEFFVQTQQLILGGRDPDLRPPATLAALAALRARGVVSEGTARDLAACYRYLRTLEHRLQMMDDEQTHTVPNSAEGLAQIACFMGRNGDTFAAELIRYLATVQGHYARLFERAAPLAGEGGSLVFTGVEDDPETLETLSRMGFRDPAHVSGAIRGWQHGRLRATRSARARELLTKLIPALLAALAATADPDAAFAQFDRFLTNLPSGVQLFSLLLAHVELLHLVASIVGSAPRLATHLSQAPATLDALLDPDFLTALPARAELDEEFDALLARAPVFEAALDAARRFAHEQIFRVGVQVIEGTAKPNDAGLAFSGIAECIVAGLLDRTAGELATTAGRVPGGAFAVIAMGKLGGAEMTAGSDLDLIFVYEASPGAETSDGARPLPVSQYYGRLAQRLIAALTVPTAEGELYEVDMQLRPTGKKGPAAVSLDSFTRYHASESWTWEHLALTRARVIAGPPSLAAKIEAVVRQTLTRPIPWAQLSADAGAMRRKVADNIPAKGAFDLKYARGGLMDIEFTAQTLQLRYGPQNPAMLARSTLDALRNLQAAGLLAEADAAVLLAAGELQLALMQVLRIAFDGTLDPATATPGLKALLVRAGAVSDFDALQRTLADLQQRAHQAFERLTGGG
jgi:[glutamine synthetase] adenylyltransferase / [glutamine synthetase]-adenylyl-L-tyrosine phosphorylase